ncbi:MAG: HAD-IA family hydrolase [Mycobacteriaceae bacterium]
MSAILFGSISVVSDTSEMQRRAFNAAFADHGLGWQWDQEQYRALLTSSGGTLRIADEAQRRGSSVVAEAVHATKSAKFQAAAAGSVLCPRDGVVETLRAAKEHGYQVGLVTTTSADNISALFSGLASVVRREDFDVVVDASAVEAAKPDPACYHYALARLGEDAKDCVAVEDNVGGVQAATAAGLTCVAFPNQNTVGHDFTRASTVVSRLDPDQLRSLAQP